MKKQYKNPFEDPDAEFYGKKVKDYKIPKRRKVPPKKKAKPAKVPDLEDYIYVPKIKLYVAKERSWLDSSWYQAHDRLDKKCLQMLTPRQFIDFILYLKQNKSRISDAKYILDEILTKREPFRGEWLDARFERGNKTWRTIRNRNGKPVSQVWYICYNHRPIKVIGKLVAQKEEPLEKCLMENYLKIDFQNCNKQGLPTKKSGCIDYIDYHCPKEDRVAVFVRSSYFAGLSCEWDPNRQNSIGVRAARKK